MPRFKIKIKIPKLPKVRVETPKVTVGGDVGAVGGRLIRGATRAIDDFRNVTVSPANELIAVVQGKPIDVAVKDVLKAHLRVSASAADVAADIDACTKAILTKAAASVGGEKAEDILADVLRAAQPYPPEYASASLKLLEQYLETGQLESLNPVAMFIAGEITNSRNLLWGRGRPIPIEVIGALPEELRPRAGVCRYLKLSEVPGNTTIPTIAIKHLQKATAVCLVDLIVFQEVPGFTGAEDLFYWCHELHHAQQYAGWGIHEFVARYVKHELASGLNPIEEDADLYACNFFPEAQPAYIKSCPA